MSKHTTKPADPEPKGRDRKDGFNPVPTPDPVADDAAAKSKVEGFTHVRPAEQPAQAGDPEADAADDRGESAKATAKAKETPLFKFSVRNTYLQADGGIRAASAGEAETQLKELLTAGLTVREG